MDNVVEEIPVQEKIESEIIDLEQNQTNGQIQPKAFWYTVKLSDGELKYLTVIASCSTVARDGIKQQFPDTTVRFVGVSEMFMQVNG